MGSVLTLCILEIRISNRLLQVKTISLHVKNLVHYWLTPINSETESMNIDGFSIDSLYSGDQVSSLLLQVIIISLHHKELVHYWLTPINSETESMIIDGFSIDSLYPGDQDIKPPLTGNYNLFAS